MNALSSVVINILCGLATSAIWQVMMQLVPKRSSYDSSAGNPRNIIHNEKKAYLTSRVKYRRSRNCRIAKRIMFLVFASIAYPFIAKWVLNSVLFLTNGPMLQFNAPPATYFIGESLNWNLLMFVSNLEALSPERLLTPAQIDFVSSSISILVLLVAPFVAVIFTFASIKIVSLFDEPSETLSFRSSFFAYVMVLISAVGVVIWLTTNVSGLAIAFGLTLLVLAGMTSGKSE